MYLGIILIFIGILNCLMSESDKTPNLGDSITYLKQFFSTGANYAIIIVTIVLFIISLLILFIYYLCAYTRKSVSEKEILSNAQSFNK
jgi:hypothetical protein